MNARIFIDGQAGTTGLGIAQRLEADGGFSLITLPEPRRKDPAARAEAMGRADLTVLCLPDDAAREAVAIAPEGARILDASTAHRVAGGWEYGFAEMQPGQAGRIAQAARVANPGCYATGAIALLRPLTVLGLLAADAPLSINAISGYSGGGKAMIAEHEAHGGPAFELYALGLKHKHLPEIMRYGGLTRAPVFVPSVGHFAQGMLVCVPLHLEQLAKAGTAPKLTEAYADYYAGSENISAQRGIWVGNLDPQGLNGTNRLEIFVCANESAGQVVLLARLDNLGKGASGAAVQNIKLMLGLENA
ncbi:MAG: N-acetyl-gamma-glutamyl-phosphate reductase [Rhodospirillales bacterium]|nr:N-acetyl-gamma-glutamyl-phosphate reductase [Rhodospirillales bacterium]MDE2319637.1 N-acetyl-gamma-glutamyl-phosphate reductase [Rhodospirillales bacterium]